jgi:hypothetical protein
MTGDVELIHESLGARLPVPVLRKVDELASNRLTD